MEEINGKRGKTEKKMGYRIKAKNPDLEMPENRYPFNNKYFILKLNSS